jgi:hypothetical protein
MTEPISFDPYLGWVDTTDPDNIPQDVRTINAADLLRYENLGIAVADRVTDLIAADEALQDSVDALDTRTDSLEADMTTVEAGLAAIYPELLPIRKSADQTRTATTTLADDSALTRAFEANDVVEVEALLWVTSPMSADIKLQLAVPAGSTGIWGAATGFGTGAGTTDGFGKNAAFSVSPTNSDVTLGTTGSLQVICLRGVIALGGTAGSITVRWAQGTSDAGDTVVKQNSLLKTRIIS